jgi:hypothetical protein
MRDFHSELVPHSDPFRCRLTQYLPLQNLCHRLVMSLYLLSYRLPSTLPQFRRYTDNAISDDPPFHRNFKHYMMRSGRQGGESSKLRT